MINADHDRLLKSFQDKLCDLENGSPEITKAQFDRIYLERAQAIRDDILKHFKSAYRGFLRNNPDVSEDELKSAIDKWLRTLEPLPGTRIGYDPEQSAYREYMSIFKPTHFRHLVDQYRDGIK
jgi:hypothetical protein